MLVTEEEKTSVLLEARKYATLSGRKAADRQNKTCAEQFGSLNCQEDWVEEEEQDDQSDQEDLIWE